MHVANYICMNIIADDKNEYELALCASPSTNLYGTYDILTL